LLPLKLKLLLQLPFCPFSLILVVLFIILFQKLVLHLLIRYVYFEPWFLQRPNFIDDFELFFLSLLFLNHSRCMSIWFTRMSKVQLSLSLKQPWALSSCSCSGRSHSAVHFSYDINLSSFNDVNKLLSSFFEKLVPHFHDIRVHPLVLELFIRLESKVVEINTFSKASFHGERGELANVFVFP